MIKVKISDPDILEKLNIKLLKSILFIFIFISFSFIIEKSLLYSLNNYSDYFEFKKFMDIKKLENKCNFLIIGSSRARNNYNPKIIDSMLNVKSYCISSTQAYFDINCMMLKYYLKYNISPKSIILDLSESCLYKYKDIVFFAQYLGVLNEDIIYNQLYKTYNKIWIYRNIPLTGLIINRYALRVSIESLFNLNNKSDNFIESGYDPLIGNFEGKVYKMYEDHIAEGKETIPLDNNKIDDLKEIIQICKNREIKLYLVYSPVYYGYLDNISNKDEISGIYKKICNENKVDILNYTDTFICKERMFFNDYEHLNFNGTDAFTKILCNDIINKNFSK